MIWGSLVSPSSPWVGAVTLAIIIVSIARRKEPIGGLLFYYLGDLPIGLFWGFALILPEVNPYALAGDTRSYAWSLGIVVPFTIARLVEALVIWRGSFLPTARTSAVILLTKRLMWVQVGMAVLSITVHALWLPKFIIFDLVSILHVAFWLPYLSRSKRISRVFREPGNSEKRLQSCPAELPKR